MGINIVIEEFSGPMDLLLNLIEKEKVDIYEIEINKITDQYIQTIQKMAEYRPEEMTEFILMASTLLEIKSRGLLPKNKYEEDDEELTKEKLIERLMEYKKFKKVTPLLKELEKEASFYFTKLPEEFTDFMEEKPVEIIDTDSKILQQRMKKLLLQINKEEEFKIESVMQREEYSVEKYMERIHQQIKEKEKLSFYEIVQGKVTKSKIIVCFLAILELLKIKVITVEQHSIEDDIIIGLRSEQIEG